MLSNTTYFEQAEQGNLVENWLFKFYYGSSGNYITFATHDTTVSAKFYRGIVLGSPTIRTRIDLAKSKASVDNLTIDLMDIPWESAYADPDRKLSAELLYGTRKYLNRKVEVFSQLNNQSDLTKCLQIGTYRLTDLSLVFGKIT